MLADLFRHLASLGAARLRSGLADLGLMLAIGLCLLVAAVFALQALHGLLVPVVGPIGAPALLAALMLIVALVMALWLSVRHSRPLHRTPAAMPPPSPLAESVTPTEAAAPAPDLGTSAAFLAGFLLARRLF